MPHHCLSLEHRGYKVGRMLVDCLDPSFDMEIRLPSMERVCCLGGVARGNTQNAYDVPPPPFQLGNPRGDRINGVENGADNAGH